MLSFRLRGAPRVNSIIVCLDCVGQSGRPASTAGQKEMEITSSSTGAGTQRMGLLDGGIRWETPALSSPLLITDQHLQFGPVGLGWHLHPQAPPGSQRGLKQPATAANGWVNINNNNAVININRLFRSWINITSDLFSYK